MIAIVPYNPVWPAMYEAEASRIREVYGEAAVRIEHVGSTAVSGLSAKPVIDIQISVLSLEPRDPHLERLSGLGYVHVPLGEFDRVYPFFQRPQSWPTTHHVHLCVAASRQEQEHLAFRNFLRANPEVAAEYLALKQELAAIHHGNTLESRERYSLAKSEFVQSVLQRALLTVPSANSSK